MVSFRSSILALAGVALFTGFASAQINSGINNSTGGPFTCQANVANPTAARSEGYAELLGDIVITCTGGNLATPGSAVPLANITVALNNTIVTSRVFSNGLSEALLMIDEPGATGTTGASGPGTTMAQNVCNSSAGVGVNGCAGGNGVYANTSSNGVSFSAACTTFTSGACTTFNTAYNVFPGVVSGNQVIFNGIPILAPVTGGLARTFRITNLRGNAAQFAGQAGSFQGQIPILASITISSVVTLTNPVQTTAFLFNGLGATTVRNAANDGGGSSALNLLQCNTAGLTAGGVLRFTEGFGNAFKTRVSTTTTYSGSSSLGNTTQTSAGFNQNFPGTINSNSESGFILTTQGGTAGLADFGTRLKAVFSNVPTGSNIFVSTTNLVGAVNNPAASNTQTQYNTLQNLPRGDTNQSIAGLVLSETAGVSSLGSFLPLVGSTNNTGAGTSLFGPLPVDANGTAMAVWEILNSNPSIAENYEFAVYYTYTGNPATNTPPTSPVGTVGMSFAPTYSTPTGGTAIPRFTPGSTSTSIISFALCQTTLLYPFVSAEPGFDTGLAIANTSSDPFGTRQQSGTCTLNFFGANQGTTNTYTTPTIATGTVYADQTSNLKAGFRGYVIAVCNFQLGHGYALFSDTGIRNWATGYLALVLPRGTGNRNSQNLNYSPTNAVEGLGN